MDAVADFGKKKKKKKTAFADFEAQIKADEELGDDEQSGTKLSHIKAPTLTNQIRYLLVLARHPDHSRCWIIFNGDKRRSLDFI